MTPSVIRSAIVRRAAWSKTSSYVLRVSESFSLVRRASTWVSRMRRRRSSIIAEKRTFRSTKSFAGRQKMLIDFRIRPRRLMQVDSVFVYRCLMSHFSSGICQTFTTRRSPSRIHIRFFSFPGMRPRRLFPSWHITRIREAPRSWSAIPRISPSFPRGIRTRTTSSCSATLVTKGREDLNVSGAVILEGRSRLTPSWVPRVALHPRARTGTGGARLEERGADDVDALRQIVFLVVDMAEPVDDGSIAEHVAVRLKLLAQMPSDLVRIAERRLGLDPILPRAVHLDRLVEQDVGRLVVFRAQVLLRLVLQAARVEPRLELRLAPSSAGILAGAALRRIHDVCVVHLSELLAQAAVLHAIQFVDHLPELFPRDLPLLEDHEGRQDRRGPALAGETPKAPPPLPHETEGGRFGLHPIKNFRLL